MIKNIFISLLLVGSCFNASWANDSPPVLHETSPAEQPASVSGINTNAESNQIANATQTQPALKHNKAVKAPLPKKIFSVATALVIGTPVCVVRRSKYEEWYGVHAMIGDSGSKCKKVLAGAFWLPFAVICGTGEAPFDALANGLMYPAFSKNQLSQGKLIQNN